MTPATPASTPGTAWRRVLLPIVIIIVLLTGAAWTARPDGYLHIFFLDTSGDAVLIQTPRGSYALIDGGSDPAQLALRLGHHLPFWRRHLDLVILTQGDGGRLPGQVAALARYQAGLVVIPAGFATIASSPDTSDAEPALQSYAGEWQRLVLDQHAPVHVVRHGEQLGLDGVQFTFFSPQTDTQTSLVPQLRYGTTSVVFDGTGQDIADSTGPITVLAYPWQRELDSPLFDLGRPQAIVFTTAYEADEPALRTYHERRLNNAAVYHGKLDGTIELVSDGRLAHIRTERP